MDNGSGRCREGQGIAVVGRKRCFSVYLAAEVQLLTLSLGMLPPMHRARWDLTGAPSLYTGCLYHAEGVALLQGGAPGQCTGC